MKRPSLALLGLLAALACTPRPTSEDDAGTSAGDAAITDAGATDASRPDAATPTDAAMPSDAAVPADASQPTDAAGPVDAAPADAAGPTDASMPDAAGPLDASAPTDGGPLDATLAPDAATRADAGDPLDAAGPPDAAGAPDASGPADAAPGTDAAGAVDAAQPADAAVAPDAAVPVDAGAPTTARIRLMAANLTAGNNQNYNTPPGDTAPGPGIRIMQGVRPDVVMVQEMRFGTDNAAGMQQFADLVLGPGAYWCREMIDGNGDLPNGIISRYPIVSCGEWQDSRVNNRDHAYARIDVPGPRDLWAISVHFHTNATSRPIEAGEIKSNILATVPMGDYVVLGGDLNTDNNTEPAFEVLDDVLVVQPQPADQYGNTATNTNRLIGEDGSTVTITGPWDPTRNKPYDWVIPGPSLMDRMVPIILSHGATTYTFPHGLVVDTRVFDAQTIPMVAPARLTDSAASNMQHMGVVRDFDLPLQ